jgi:hypothetical protein
MKAAGYDVRETDPFAVEQPPRPVAPVAPIVARMQELWEAMRTTVIETFPSASIPLSRDAYLRSVDDVYPRDAYHSLAMERFRVTPAVIERTRWSGGDATGDEEVRHDPDALAARGYWLAFRSVREAIAQVLAGANAGALARTAHLDWRRQLLQPFVRAGLSDPTDSGESRHRSEPAAPRWKAVRDAVPALFDLLERETEASVRAVLGHWMFGYIHRYTDDDGRLARFVLNIMLASGGYPWTVIRVDDRSEYMAALDAASADADIEPLSRFIGSRVPPWVEPLPA